MTDLGTKKKPRQDTSTGPVLDWSLAIYPHNIPLLMSFLFCRLNVKTVCVFKKRFVSKLFVNISVLNRL
jgi:hypothetical protein